MTSLISSLTNIHTYYLIDQSRINTACVAQKMSWASERKTTRPEDKAYCLTGLFDVTMPLLYGEGEKAFHRLQLEIIKNSSDESIFAWGATSFDKPKYQRIYGIIAEDPRYFKDCGEIVSETSFRPPYLINKGLQLEANLVQIRESPNDLPLNRVLFNGAQWMLILYCKWLYNKSMRLYIHVIEDKERQIWARVSDVVHYTSGSSGRYIKDDDEFEKCQIIMQATRSKAGPWTAIVPRYFFLLDTLSAIEHGFLVYVHVWEGGKRTIKLGNDGRYMSSVLPCMTVECKKVHYSLQLKINCQPRGTSKVAIGAQLNDKDLALAQDKGVLLESGEVLRAILKRKAHNGTQLYVVELKLEQGREAVEDAREQPIGAPGH